jgi:hypothetical protein
VLEDRERQAEGQDSDSVRGSAVRGPVALVAQGQVARELFHRQEKQHVQPGLRKAGDVEAHSSTPRPRKAR